MCLKNDKQIILLSLSSILMIVIAISLIGCAKCGGELKPEDNIYGKPAPRPAPAPGPSQTPLIQILSPAIGATFVSTDQITCSALINTTSAYTLSWLIRGAQGPLGGPYSYTGYKTDSICPILYVIQNQDSAPNGRNAVLAQFISLTVNIASSNYINEFWIAQDEIDKCRQEYIDIRRDGEAIGYYPPDHDYFSYTVASTNPACSVDFSHANLARSSKYDCIVVGANLLAGMETLRHAIDDTDETHLYITSCYRNPVKNESLREQGSALKSDHMWGAAVDFVVPDFNGDGIIGKSDWEDMHDDAIILGAKYVESPLRKNSDPVYIYIHIQWTKFHDQDQEE